MTDRGLATMDALGLRTVYGFDGRSLASETLPLLAERVHLFYSADAPGEIRYAFGIATVPESDPAEMDEQGRWNLGQVIEHEGKRKDGVTSAEREELRRLRKENRQLKQEREILSKAAAWFAQSDVTSSRSSSS